MACKCSSPAARCCWSIHAFRNVARRHFTVCRPRLAPSYLSSTHTIYKLTDSGVVKSWCVLSPSPDVACVDVSLSPYDRATQFPNKQTTEIDTQLLSRIPAIVAVRTTNPTTIKSRVRQIHLRQKCRDVHGFIFPDPTRPDPTITDKILTRPQCSRYTNSINIIRVVKFIFKNLTHGKNTEVDNANVS